MNLEDLSKGDVISIDHERLSGRLWEVVGQRMVDIGVVTFPLVVASDGSERIRMDKEDDDDVEVVTEDEDFRIELKDIALHNS